MNELRTKRDNRFRLTMGILCALCFMIHVYGVTELYSPFLYTEEMGYWTNAATFVGYDWSPSAILSKMPWYTYGYSLTLVPLFWLFDNMASMYKAAIILNALWATLSFVLCYHIAKRLGKEQNRYWLLFISFIVSVYSAYVHQSSIAIVETFLYFLIWLLFWLFLRYEEQPTWRRGVCLGAAVSFVYVTHNRTIGIMVAFAMTMAIMMITRKLSWKEVLPVILPIIVVFEINQQVTVYLSGKIYGQNDKFMSDYSNQFENLKRLFTNRYYFILFIKSCIGKYWYICTASFMLCVWGLLYALQTLWTKFRRQKEISYSLIFYLLSYAGVIVISALFTTPNIPSQFRRTDYIIYGRYAECACGIFLLLGFLKLLNLHRALRREKIIYLYGPLAAYLASYIVVKGYTDYVYETYNNVSAPNGPINSINGIFFYNIMGDFSLFKCTFLALLAAVIVFLAFLAGGKANEFKIPACVLILAAFLYTGWYSSSIYTFPNQSSNSRDTFVQLVDAVESSLSGKKIFIDSTGIYTYYDFQNCMIHNTIYPGNAKNLKKKLRNGEKYDMIIGGAATVDYVPIDSYRPWVVNSEFAIFCSNELADELQVDFEFPTDDILKKYGLSPLWWNTDSVSGGVPLSLDMFSSRNNVSQDDASMRSSGAADFLLFGPYIRAGAGDYQVTIKGKLIAGELDETSFFDVVNAQGEDRIKLIPDLSRYIKDDQFELNVNFKLRERSDNCEFRLYVNEGVQLEIDQVTIACQ